MQKTVKHALLHYYIEIEDPISHESRTVERLATHGMKLSTEPMPNDPDQSMRYDVPEKEIRRLEQQHPGCFFTDLEEKMKNSGVSDRLGPISGFNRNLGDTHTTPGQSFPDPDASAVTTITGDESGHPLSLRELSVDQLAAYITSEGVTVNELLEEAHASPDLVDLILAADSMAGGGEPREDLVIGMAQIRSIAPAGPTGSEGVDVPLPPEAEQEGGPQVGPTPLDEVLANAQRQQAGAGGDAPPETPEDGGEPQEGEGDAAPDDDAPASAASRGEWDTYAESKGLNPADFPNKESLIKALGKE